MLRTLGFRVLKGESSCTCGGVELLWFFDGSAPYKGPDGSVYTPPEDLVRFCFIMLYCLFHPDRILIRHIIDTDA